MENRKTHKCRKCGHIYSFVPHKDACNTYVDAEDTEHYDCPKCGTFYYYPLGVNFLGNFLRNIFY